MGKNRAVDRGDVRIIRLGEAVEQKDAKVGFSSINARAETVDTAPAFRDAWRRGPRCLVITDGFCEWKKPEKQPYAVAMAEPGRMMVMAGLWDEWTDRKTGERIRSCTIVSCPPNAVIGALHDRMPVILAEQDWPQWLGERPATAKELKALLVPSPDEALKLWPVNRQRIGNVRPRWLSRRPWDERGRRAQWRSVLRRI